MGQKSGSLMRLQCGCQWGATFISRLEDTLPRWLMPMAVGWRPQLLSVWPSPQSCLSVLTTWQPWPKVSGLRKRRARRKLQCFYDPVSKVHHYFHFIVSVRSESLSPFHRQGKKELNSTLEWRSITLWIFLKHQTHLKQAWATKGIGWLQCGLTYSMNQVLGKEVGTEHYTTLILSPSVSHLCLLWLSLPVGLFFP